MWSKNVSSISSQNQSRASSSLLKPLARAGGPEPDWIGTPRFRASLGYLLETWGCWLLEPYAILAFPDQKDPVN
jgi:hypothetical protein